MPSSENIASDRNSPLSRSRDFRYGRAKPSVIIVATAADSASRWPSGSATTMRCMPYTVAPDCSRFRCMQARMASEISAIQNVRFRRDSEALTPTSATTEVISSRKISG